MKLPLLWRLLGVKPIPPMPAFVVDPEPRDSSEWVLWKVTQDMRFDEHRERWRRTLEEWLYQTRRRLFLIPAFIMCFQIYNSSALLMVNIWRVTHAPYALSCYSFFTMVFALVVSCWAAYWLGYNYPIREAAKRSDVSCPRVPQW